MLMKIIRGIKTGYIWPLQCFIEEMAKDYSILQTLKERVKVVIRHILLNNQFTLSYDLYFSFLAYYNVSFFFVLMYC